MNAFLEAQEGMEQLLDMVDGHRAELLRRGYSETATEAMAVAFHAALMVTMAAGVASGVKK